MGVVSEGPKRPAAVSGAVPDGVGMTALRVAAVRAQEGLRPDRLFDDPLAARFLEAAGRPLPSTEIEQAERAVPPQWLTLTRLLDEFTQAALAAGARSGQWVGFAGEGGESGGDLVDAGADVGGGGPGVVAVVGVAGVGACGGIAEVALYSGQGGVAQLVGGDLLGGHPGQVGAEARPEVVVASAGDRRTTGVAQQRAVLDGAAVLGVVVQVGHQGGGDRLPAHGLALLPQEDQTLVRVEIARAQRQGAAATAGGFGVQPQQERVQGGVVAGGRGDVVDLGQPGPEWPAEWRATGGAWPPHGPGWPSG